MKVEIVFKGGRKETFDNVENFNVTEEQTANEECYASEVAQTTTEEKLFKVNPLEIDRRLFQKVRENVKQEGTRKLIQEAFAKVDKYPKKYATPFYILIPEKYWGGYREVRKLKEYANDLGDHMTDKVEQALEWAQRIFNGESWETICNNADTAKWHRLIAWKMGCYKIVGGSRECHSALPPSHILCKSCQSDSQIRYTVPSIVIYDKEKYLSTVTHL